MPSSFTPQQLYDSIKDVKPMDMDLLLRLVEIHETYMEELNLKADDLDFIWKVRDVDYYESLPMFSWEQIFTFCK